MIISGKKGNVLLSKRNLRWQNYKDKIAIGIFATPMIVLVIGIFIILGLFRIMGDGFTYIDFSTSG